MKNRLLLAAAVLFAVGVTTTAADAKSTASKPAHTAVAKAPPIRIAPADEYFGKMKISILGINNTIHDTNLHIGYDRPHAANYYSTLIWAEDALRDWAHKYPQDTWLPGRAYYMSHVFWQMHTADADAAANRCRSLLFHQFPKSHWAVLARGETSDKIAPLTVEAAAQTSTNLGNTQAVNNAALPAGQAGSHAGSSAVANPVATAAPRQK